MDQTAQKDSLDPKESAVVEQEQLLTAVESQEIWASRVTYYRNWEGRQEESKASGGGDFYARVKLALRMKI